MKIIRWLLSHAFLILLIVAVIYGYMFWGNLLGKDTPAGKAIAYLSSEFVAVEEFVNAVKEKQAQSGVAGKAVQQKPAVTVQDTADTTTADQVLQTAEPMQPAAAMDKPTEQYVESSEITTAAEVAEVEQAQMEQQAPSAATAPVQQQQVQQQQEDFSAAPPQQEPVLESASAPPVDIQANPSSDQPETVTALRPATEMMAQETTEQAFVTPEIEEQLENVDQQGRIIDETKTDDTVRANWITARKSFYQRNYELSEQSYQKVIDNTDDNFDAYGELGNVYFNQGKNKQAASAYFEAAAILVRKGQVNRARSLMGLLRHLDQEKASELQKLIDSTVS